MATYTHLLQKLQRAILLCFATIAITSPVLAQSSGKVKLKSGWYAGISESEAFFLKLRFEPRGENFQFTGTFGSQKSSVLVKGTYFTRTNRLAGETNKEVITDKLISLGTFKLDGFLSSDSKLKVKVAMPASIFNREIEIVNSHFTSEPSFSAITARAKAITARENRRPAPTVAVWSLTKTEVAPAKGSAQDSYTYTATGATYILDKRDAAGAAVTQCNASWSFVGIPKELRPNQDVAITIEGKITRGGVEVPHVRMSAYCNGEGLTPGEIEPAIIGVTQGVFKTTDVGSFLFKVPSAAPDTIKIILGGDFGVGFIAAYTYQKRLVASNQINNSGEAVTAFNNRVAEAERASGGDNSTPTPPPTTNRKPGTKTTIPTTPGTAQRFPPGVVGKVISVKGKVDISQDGEGYVPYKPGMQIRVGTKINTGWQSEFVFEREDGHIIRMEQLSYLRIKDKEVFLRYGQLKHQLQRPGGPASDFEVKTATTAASIRGTIYTINVDKETDTTTIAVERGSVLVKPENPRLAQVIVGAGKKVIIKHDTMSAVLPR